VGRWARCRPVSSGGSEVADAAIEEDQGADGPVVGGRGDAGLGGEVVREGDDVVGPRARGWRGRWKRKQARNQWR
jgi:hypothetical protein